MKGWVHFEIDYILVSYLIIINNIVLHCTLIVKLYQFTFTRKKASQSKSRLINFLIHPVVRYPWLNRHF